MFGRTRSVVLKMLNDLNNIRKKFNVFMQICMLGLSTYNLANTTIYLIKYIVQNGFDFANEWYLFLRPFIFLIMFGLTLYWFIYSRKFAHKKEVTKESKEKRNKTGDIIKYIKMGFRPILLGYTLVDYIVNVDGRNTLSLVLCIISIASYLFQILLTIVTKWFEGYIELIQVAFEEDIKPVTSFIEKANKTKEAITNPLYTISKAIAKKAEGEEEEIDEEKQEKIDLVNKLNDSRVQKAKDNKEERKEKFKQQRKEFIDKLGENIKKLRLLKKKNKEDKKENEETQKDEK